MLDTGKESLSARDAMAPRVGGMGAEWEKALALTSLSPHKNHSTHRKTIATAIIVILSP